ncbi:hypothetical protein PHMEG_00018728 [Phytophthora megakarya]|uniref:Uncharacterized protein n=1 Tax=Phytophthora megakarya TaxID=4795 RepID=A0A225VUN2_9STRA|nr:hypothetical protein PHMEG_00018728 [Phytophthora megakarya]
MCATYEDLLVAVGGLISFSNELWCDHARRLLSPLKHFILSNMKPNNNTPERVRFTLMYVNRFLGRALAHLLRDFSEAVRAVDYHSSDWQAELNGLALRLCRRRMHNKALLREPQPHSRDEDQPLARQLCRSTYADKSLAMMTAVSPASVSWQMAYAIAVASSAVRNIVAPIAGTGASRAICRGLSIAATIVTVANTVAPTAPEVAEVLLVCRRFGTHEVSS